MKLNLCCGKDIRNNYINIDVFQYSDDNYKQGDFSNLDWICEDNSVEEILVSPRMNIVRVNQLEQMIRGWCSKLKPGGIIKISFIDCHLLASYFVTGQISINEFLAGIFGQQQNEVKLSSIDMLSLTNILSNSGISIKRKFYEGLYGYIEAEKT